MSSMASSVLGFIGIGGKEDSTNNVDVASTGPEIEDGEGPSETLFFSLLEEVGDDELVVRSVRKLKVLLFYIFDDVKVSHLYSPLRAIQSSPGQTRYLWSGGQYLVRHQGC